MKELSFNYAYAGVEKDAAVQQAQSLLSYTDHLKQVIEKGGYTELEASLNLLSDQSLRSTISEMVKAKETDELKYVVVIGIGGSNLGTKAAYEAMRGVVSGHKHNQAVKLLFADTVSAKLLSDLQYILDKDIETKDQILINIVTKSGGTTETISNFEVLYAHLSEKLGDIKDRIVATTDKDSKLWKQAEALGISLLEVPSHVGGRFSVFSAVGLFPLMLAGFDIDLLHKGAMAMRDRGLSQDLEQNSPMLSAILTYKQYQAGLNINNNFIFNPELESVGKWYRQLMGESLGKAKDLSGATVHAGITPIVSIGSTDLHSMAQLYFGGPKDKFTNFVYAFQPLIECTIPSDQLFSDSVKGISGKSIQEVMGAIYDGVKKGYEKNQLPYIEVVWPEISEYTIGQYLQMKMLEIMYLAQLMHVNAFDQPNVEDYKKETREILEA